MKFLILTQKVDRNDPILGFFHRWIEEFVKRCERVIIICLEEGEYNLSQNVKVFSLGKEGSHSRAKYLWNFYKYLWQERKNYDAVFVHLNQEYVLLGGILWLLLGKKVFMWRNHHMGNFLTDLAGLFCSKIFCTSKYSYTAKHKKTVLMPVGIDTDKIFREISSAPVSPYAKVLKYIISGGTAATVDLVFLFFFTSLLHIWYIISAVLAFLIAFGVSFLLQKFWTFNDLDTKRWKSQMAKYLLIAVTNLGINTLLMYIFVDYLSIQYLIAQIIAGALVAGESYFVYQLLVFKSNE